MRKNPWISVSRPGPRGAAQNLESQDPLPTPLPPGEDAQQLMESAVRASTKLRR